MNETLAWVWEMVFMLFISYKGVAAYWEFTYRNKVAIWIDVIAITAIFGIIFIPSLIWPSPRKNGSEMLDLLFISAFLIYCTVCTIIGYRPFRKRPNKH